jgi:glutamyl-tRNA synthetase
MHVGNVRTAIFNWLFARSDHGQFLLRIEDTDPERSRREWVDVILDGLRWLGIDWDGEPVYQSQRMETYREVAHQFLAQGIAYRCFCDPEELKERQKHTYRYDGRCRSLSPEDIEAKAGQPFAIRLRSTNDPIIYQDGVHGRIEVSGQELDDLVLLRRDQTPTYQFAVVIDDHDMGITHVIRGDDHISNTPKQIQIYRALDWEIPRFYHLPMILGPDRKPLAKRHGAASLGELRHKGFLPQAVLNYLSLLGWSPGDNREVLNQDALIAAFNLDRISTGSAIFDITKLEWLNWQYLSNMPAQEIYQHLQPFVTDLPMSQGRWLPAIDMLKTRTRVLTDFLTKGGYLFADPESYDPNGVSKHWKHPDTSDRLRRLIEVLSRIEPFKEETIETEMRALAEDMGVSAAKLIHPTRLALTGFTVSPGLFELMAHLGRDTVLRRLKAAINYLANSKDFLEREP